MAPRRWTTTGVGCVFSIVASMSGPAPKAAAEPRGGAVAPLSARPTSLASAAANTFHQLPRPTASVRQGQAKPDAVKQSILVLDPRFGHGSHALTTVNGVTAVPQEVGSLTGGTLLHVFTKLELAPQDTLTFLPARQPTARVARVWVFVSGRTPTELDGTVTNAISGAGLDVFNANGVQLGPNAVELLSPNNGVTQYQNLSGLARPRYVITAVQPVLAPTCGDAAGGMSSFNVVGRGGLTGDPQSWK